jgi:hypothetical protein
VEVWLCLLARHQIEVSEWLASHPVPFCRKLGEPIRLLGDVSFHHKTKCSWLHLKVSLWRPGGPLKSTVFWDVSSRGFNITRRFGGTCRLLLLRGRRNNASEANRETVANRLMEATCSSETSVYNKPTRRHTPEDCILHSHVRENPKFCRRSTVLFSLLSRLVVRQNFVDVSGKRTASIIRNCSPSAFLPTVVQGDAYLTGVL